MRYEKSFYFSHISVKKKEVFFFWLPRVMLQSLLSFSRPSKQVNVVVRQRPKQDESQQRRRAQGLAHEQPDFREREVLGPPGALGPQRRGGHGLPGQVVEEARPALDAQDAGREGGGQGEGDGAVVILCVCEWSRLRRFFFFVRAIDPKFDRLPFARLFRARALSLSSFRYQKLT